MLRVGLTGGIGAGKSTVAAALADLGAVVIDADKVSREVVEPGTDGLAEIVAAFGADVLDADGALDRPSLGRIVFADDERRAQLNAIVHPRVGARTAELVEAAPGDAVVVHDVPLLVENGLGPAYALVIVVDAPVEVRVERLARSRGMSEDDARSRIAAQADDDARCEAADVWIDNSVDAGEVRAAVSALWADRIVPFEENLRAGRAVPASDGVVTPGADRERQGRRLAARVRHACPGARVEHTDAADVVELIVHTDDGCADALVRAGFPRVGPGEHGGADPARPVRLRVRGGA